MIPRNPEDMNINESQQGVLEIAEYFYRVKRELDGKEGDIKAESINEEI
ncbi:MAG: hypothetical protein ACOY31_00540 [Bacillota bacterium]